MNFFLKCFECDRKITAETARAMREHADAVYSFVCSDCYSSMKGE